VLKAGEAGHKKARQRAPLDFGGLVQECVEVARNSYHLPPAALRYEQNLGNGSRANVIGDSDQLRTPVSNLLDNAIKCSGNAIDVSVRVEMPDEKRITMSVRDRGVGVPEQDLKRIFKRFYRVPHRSLAHVKGTGLGLFIVRAIASKHGGRVFAESQ